MARQDSDDTPQTEQAFVGAWLEAIDDTEREEKDWTKSADKSEQVYRGDSGVKQSFNLYHSNVEIKVPALYNSTPVPDVRRRYNDDDKASKAGADIIERSLSYSVDMYDFDGLMQACVKDMVIADRGVARVKYVPTFIGEGEEQTVGYEEVRCEYVPWRAFRRGPGRVWGDVAWIAFEHYLGKTEIEKLNPKIAATLPYTFSAEAKTDAKRQSENLPRFGKRARVWEIWDKDERKVHWVCPEHGRERIAVMDDPLELKDFFPCPRPMQAIGTPSSLVPVTEYSIYANLLDELNVVTKRIKNLVTQLRPRGGYAGVSTDFNAIANAPEGELVPLTTTDLITATGGDLNKLIAWFPLDPITKALQQLIFHRDQIKLQIYEVTGISDILRGASNPNETLGAQQIKAQMGSMRIQAQQREVQRFARDLFRLKAELMCNKFAFETLSSMTGLKFPTTEEKQAIEGLKAQYEQTVQQAQAQGQPPPPPPISPEMIAQGAKVLESPTREEIEAILRNDATRGYRIDIESDSTVRGDVMRNTQQMSQFVQGLGGFIQAVGPIVQADPSVKEPLVEMIGAFSRMQKLGKQTEDALDRWLDKARKEAANPQPQPDPNAEKMKLEMERMKAKMEADKQSAQLKQQGQMMGLKAEEQKLGMQAQAQEREFQMDERRMGMEEKRAAAEFERDMVGIQAKTQADLMKAQMGAMTNGS
jgi:hypothetical protein